MKPEVVLLGLVLLLDAASAAEESCTGRCGTFDPQSKCQCDSMCVYYGSCCGDFYTICPRKIARGDTFDEPEEVTPTTLNLNTIPTTVPQSADTIPTTVPQSAAPNTTQANTPAVDPDAAPCSGRPFDAFLQLKNGSVFAFRGVYFFELDDKSVLPGYPKLIQDVWGIPGPVSAAFTRINCQGKTYIFKGNKYWRFDGDMLDKDYPRDISVGFDGIPDDIDAAFAVPAASHRGNEKVYFFKGDKYYQYEFKHQPSHEECVRISRSSPSMLFTHYTDLYCDQTLEDLFTQLFGSSMSSHQTSPRLINRDWQGIRPPVDAIMVGQVHLTPKPTRLPSIPSRRRSSRKRRPARRGGARRKSRDFLLDDLWFSDDLFDLGPYSDLFEESPVQEYRETPVQNVYFFKRDKYFRVSLQTKRVDTVVPPYPRSIAKYWLGCDHEEAADVSRAEKR
ncbi:vitronectin b [Gouania willdenowi]|uniref:vitronectin b n=1 Tax=Gouania willdenowi TaxID=441366 RepID=UPI001055870B|nr:vitronectin-like [Gouania willdenowi]